MVEKLRSLARIVANEINKQNLLNNASGKVQEKLSNVQSIVGAKYETIVKRVNDEVTMLQSQNGPRLQSAPPVPMGIIKWWRWYQQLTGLDAVEVSRERVVAAQDMLFKCQDNRRVLNRQVAMLNEKLKEVYGELIQTKRDDPKYVQLTIIENKSLQDQAKVMSELDLLEKEEKEYFTLLTTAIKEYHVAQSMTTQKYKYLSIVASALLAIISLVCSMIYNNKRIGDVRNVIGKAQEKNEAMFLNAFQSMEVNFKSMLASTVQKLEEISKGNKALFNNGKSTQQPSESVKLFDNQGELYVTNIPRGIESVKTYTIVGLSILCIYLGITVYG